MSANVLDLPALVEGRREIAARRLHERARDYARWRAIELSFGLLGDTADAVLDALLPIAEIVDTEGYQVGPQGPRVVLFGTVVHTIDSARRRIDLAMNLAMIKAMQGAK